MGNFLEKGGSFLAKTSTSIAVHTLAFTAGAVNAFTSDHLGGAGLVDAEQNGLTDSKGLAFQIGQKFGHAGGLLAGITELTGEGAGEDLSLGFATVPVAVAVPFSLSAIGTGAYHLVNDKIVYSTGTGKSGNSTQPKKYSNDAEKIGNGHAWSKHKSEFPEVKDQDSFKSLIDKIMKDKNSLHKKLLRGREAWYDKSTNTVVIKDQTSPDGGTAFRPTDKINYFNNSLK